MFRHPISTPFAIPLPLLRSFHWKLRLAVVQKTWGPWWGPSYRIRACIALLMHLGFESQGSRGARGQEVGLTPPNLPRPNLLSHHIIVIFFSIWESLFVVCVLIFFPCSVYICQATLISYKTEIIVTIIIIKTLVCSMVSAIRHHRAALGHLAFS